MQATALVWTDPAPGATPTNRAAINRTNSQHSTGPRTAAGKQRSSLNAIRHGLTARTAVLSSEDLAAYQRHCRQFVDEYQPANATETQLVQDLADTSWRLNRIPASKPRCSPKSPAPKPWSPPSPASACTAPASACTAPASRVSSKRPSSSCAKSNSSAANMNAASSKTPPQSSNSISIKEFRRSPPIMASFFQKIKLNVARSA